MPALPSSILNPIRHTFLALIPIHHDTHPLGCHRPRIADAVVFDKLVEALVFGAGYERIADATCSATTLRRRRDEWSQAGLFTELAAAASAALEKMIGLDLDDLAVDGCITKAPCGGEMAGRSPVDRGKQGTKRSQLVDGAGIPLATVPAPANTRDHTLLAATLDVLKDYAPLPPGVRVHLDAGYDYAPCRTALERRGLAGVIARRGIPAPCRTALERRGLAGVIARRGIPAPIQVGKRWVVERTNSWMNDFGKLRRCTERRERCVQAYLDLAAAIITVRALLRAAWYRYRWPTRPRTPRIR